MLFLVFALVVASAYWLTGIVRRVALKHRVLDIPNERSSHAEVRPRGGGLAIVASVLGGLVWLAAAHAVAWRHAVALGGGGALAAAIGFADDCMDVRPRWRLLVHFTSAAWLMAWLGGSPAVLGPALGHWADLLAILYLVWVLNLTNFMDGIDAIAGIETLTVALGGAVASALAAPHTGLWLPPAVLAAATLGFLKWNWPPAKIFMGDAGSGFVGLLLAGLSLEAAHADSRLFWAWLILMAAFVTDATITLARRIFRCERFYQAHRTHAYQHAARRLASHTPVTLAVGAINVGWLLPWALLVATRRISPLSGLGIAYTPVLFAAIWLGAGTADAADDELRAGPGLSRCDRTDDSAPRVATTQTR